MHRFFIKKENCISDKEAVLTDEQDVKHLVRVLRANIGEKVELCVDHEKELICQIQRIEDKAVYFSVEAVSDRLRESPIEIHLYQGLPKADKMEWIVQKNVELGINGVTPVQMARSVAKIADEKDNKKKTERWQKIADEAAKQSKRLVQANIGACIKFKALENLVSDYDLFLVPYEIEKSTGLKGLLADHSEKINKIAILVGPEGGIDEAEIEKLVSLGAKPITLGPRILRTETAGLTTVTMLQYALGDLG